MTQSINPNAPVSVGSPQQTPQNFSNDKKSGNTISLFDSGPNPYEIAKRIGLAKEFAK